MGTHHGHGGAEVSDTPETDEELAKLGFGYYTMGGLPADAVKVEFARKLERERDEARFDLAFRRDLYELQQKQLDEARLERDEWKEVAEGGLLGAIRERDEAIQARKVSAADWLNQIANADLRVTRIKRERDEARELAANLEISLTAAIRSANVRQDETEHAMHECSELRILVDGLSEMNHELSKDRDLWKSEAEIWRAIR